MTLFANLRTMVCLPCLLGAGVLAGCATDGSSERPPEEEVSRERGESKVPWGAPQGWEGSTPGGVNPGLGQ